MSDKLNIYVGFDRSNDGQMLAFEICRKSILKNTKHKDKVEVHQIHLGRLIDQELYKRDLDKLAATEFTYSRFLVPRLNNYQGICVFCDSDFIWECDAYEELMPYIEKMRTENKAVGCVQHDYTPKDEYKMDSRKQTMCTRHH